MPPSERATFRSGKRRSVGPNSRSWAVMALIWQASTMRWSTGASAGRWITSKPAPMCSDSTMFSSHSAVEHRVPVAREEAREALHVRRLEEADRAAALLGDAAHLVDGERRRPTSGRCRAG